MYEFANKSSEYNGPRLPKDGDTRAYGHVEFQVVCGI